MNEILPLNKALAIVMAMISVLFIIKVFYL